MMCGAEVFTATVSNTGPAVMSNRTALIVLAAAALSMMTASASTREVVRYNAEAQPGTIVVKTAERRLYLVLGDGTAIRYTEAVGRPGKQWQGKAQVSGKYVQPAWTPPAEVRADDSALPDVIPGGVPNNPMGVAALPDGPGTGARAALVATNSPFNDRVAIHTKEAPYRTYALAGRVQRGSIPDALYSDTLDRYHYVRLQPADEGYEWLISGGEDHKSGEASDMDERLARLEAWTREHFPNKGAIERRWSGMVRHRP